MIQANHGEHMKTVRTSVASSAKGLKKKYKGLKITTLTDKAMQAKLKNPQAFARWWNSMTGDAQYIFELKPAGNSSKIFVDDACGRFLVSYGDEDRRSFSWTKRGMKSAQMHALKHLWEAHTRKTGQICPVDLSSVEAF